jgi:hypothetical protein
LLAPLGVQGGDQVAAVIHRELGVGIQHLMDVAIVGLLIFAFDGIDGDTIVFHERSRHIILRGEWVRGAQGNLRAARLERAHQIGSLGGYMETRRDTDAAQRLLLLKSLADEAQHRHLVLCPFDAQGALLRQTQVLHIITHRRFLQGDCTLKRHLGDIVD